MQELLTQRVRIRIRIQWSAEFGTSKHRRSLLNHIRKDFYRAPTNSTSKNELCLINSLLLVTTIRMSGSKAVIGFSWEPKLPTFSTSSSSSDKQKSQNHAVAGSLWKPSTELVDGLFVPPNDPKKLNKLLRKQVKDTTGRNWFDMPAPTITPELKKDLQLLKLRNVMDPKRHYKKGNSKLNELPKYFQVGTVIESPVDFFTGRLTKRERKPSLADELLADGDLAAYRKRKVREIDEELRPGGVDKWKIRGKQSLKRAKQRRH